MRSRESSVEPTSNCSSASGGCFRTDSEVVIASRAYITLCPHMTDSEDDPSLRNTFYRKVTRSSRTMTPSRRLLYRIAIPLGLSIIRLWWRMCRIVRVDGVEHLDAALSK